MSPSAHCHPLRPPLPPSPPRRGFTLVEMLMVLALIAILASLAYPSYQRSLRKAHRLDAQTSLQTLALAEQRFYGRHGHYSLSLVELGYPDPATSTDGYYLLALDQDVPPENGFLASASPHPDTDQVNDTCPVFLYDANGPVYRPATAQACWH